MPAAIHPADRPGGPAHGLSAEQIKRLVAESRAAQGLPPTVKDPVVIDRLATLLREEP
jgi:hypothetical protein